MLKKTISSVFIKYKKRKIIKSRKKLNKITNNKMRNWIFKKNINILIIMTRREMNKLIR